MIEQSYNENAEVAITKGNSPKEVVLEGIEKLGGISKFINRGESVFIKFNLNLPHGFPTNTNLNVLEVLIDSCKKAGASKVYLGSFPVKGISIAIISNSLELDKYFKTLGAELVYLDNSNYYNQKGLKPDQLKQIKEESFSEIEANDKKIRFPNRVLNSDKLIIVNQVNVEPLFKCTLSLLNYYSIIPNSYQEIGKNVREGKDYLYLDQYKQDLISNIIDISTIKKPDLVINDLFYIMEGAGPYIYRDSKLKTTGLGVVGTDAVAVDLITLKLMGVNKLDSKLILEAQNKRVGITDISKINVLGESVEDNIIEIAHCVSKLGNIKTPNFSIKSGRFCSGCLRQAYHFLNFIKTHMVKDLKYNPGNSFLIGEDPLEPEDFENIILFGDCCINSTINRSFRKLIMKESKKKKSKTEKSKVKINKKILELPGCPPDILNVLERLLHYYGKSNSPNLKLISEIIKSWRSKQTKEKLELWEEL